MTIIPTLPKPIRTFTDPITGVTIHQLTEGIEPSAHLYFTRSCWMAGGKYFLFVRRQDLAVNFYVVGPDGEMRQLTHQPPAPEPMAFLPHMHRRFFAWEIESLLMRAPAVHPTLPLFVYTWLNEVHLVDVEHNRDEVLYIFPRSESEQPFTGLHCSFTADGQDLIFTSTRRTRAGEPRLDPPSQTWSMGLRDETGFVSSIWRFDFQRRCMLNRIFVSNGEQSHVLTCPWDSELLLWVNYLHSAIYTINRDGSGLRKLLALPDSMPGHYNWDLVHRRLTLVYSEFGPGTSAQSSLDLSTGELHRLPVSGGRAQWHQNVSPDGRWIVIDAEHITVGDSTGLNLIDQAEEKLHPLCQIRCSWNPPPSPDGRAIKSEFLHPNPSWSPDGRYVVFSSDFGGGIEAVEIYAVDISTLGNV